MERTLQPVPIYWLLSTSRLALNNHGSLGAKAGKGTAPELVLKTAKPILNQQMHGDDSVSSKAATLFCRVPKRQEGDHQR